MSEPAGIPGGHGTRAAVLGAGSWGTTFAKVLADAGCAVTLHARRPELAEAMAATRSAPAPVISQITWLIRLVLPSSIPFISDSSTASSGSSGAHSVRLLRSDWEGTARTTMSAPCSASAGSVVARSPSGSRMPGR